MLTSETPVQGGSMKPIIIDFAKAYTLTQITLIMLTEILIQFASIDIGNVSDIAALLGAMFYVGHLYASRTGEMPTSRFAWRVAFALALTATVISIIINAILLFIFREEIARQALQSLITSLSVGWWMAIIAGVMLIYVLMIRYFFTFAVKSALKQKKKAE